MQSEVLAEITFINKIPVFLAYFIFFSNKTPYCYELNLSLFMALPFALDLHVWDFLAFILFFVQALK